VLGYVMRSQFTQVLEGAPAALAGVREGLHEVPGSAALRAAAQRLRDSEGSSE